MVFFESHFTHCIGNKNIKDNSFTLKGQYRHDQSRLLMGIESVSSYKMNTVTENYWLIYAAAMVIWPHHVGYYGSHCVNIKTNIPIPCPVDRDDTAPGLSQVYCFKSGFMFFF